LREETLRVTKGTLRNGAGNEIFTYDTRDKRGRTSKKTAECSFKTAQTTCLCKISEHFLNKDKGKVLRRERRLRTPYRRGFCPGGVSKKVVTPNYFNLRRATDAAL